MSKTLTGVFMFVIVALTAPCIDATSVIAATQPFAKPAAFVGEVTSGPQHGTRASLHFAQSGVTTSPSDPTQKKKAKKITNPCVKRADGTVVCPPTLDAAKQPGLKQKGN
jgi:hypothetical protein